MKLNRTLIGSTIVAALGGLLFGFDTIVLSGAQSQLRELFNLSGLLRGFMTASALIRTVIFATIMVSIFRWSEIFSGTKGVALEDIERHRAH